MGTSFHETGSLTVAVNVKFNFWEYLNPGIFIAQKKKKKSLVKLSGLLYANYYKYMQLMLSVTICIRSIIFDYK